MATLEGLAYCAHCVNEATKNQGFGKLRGLGSYDPVVGNRNFPMSNRFVATDMRGFGLTDEEIDKKLQQQYGTSGGDSSGFSIDQSKYLGGSSGSGVPWWQGLAEGITKGGIDALTGGNKPKPIIIKEGPPWGLIAAVGGGALLLILLLRRKAA